MRGMNGKKIIAIILVCGMIISIAPYLFGTVFASNPDNIITNIRLVSTTGDVTVSHTVLNNNNTYNQL